ncbi:MAG: phage holin family protein [Candidatus Terrybacteria bacterium]|nr:phage holin family protein [Candidatus Terrybacteria bacterium]
MPFFVTVLENAVGLLVAVWALPQVIPESISFTGDFWQLLVAGAVIGFINGIVRPALRLLSLPLLILTAGTFGFILNIGLLWLADYFLPDLAINGVLPLAITTMILAIVHVIL